MRVSVKRDAFARLLDQNLKAVECRTTIPILANMLLSFDGERLEIRSTDLDIQITSFMDAEGEPGTATIEAKKLTDIVKWLKTADLTITADDTTAKIKAGRSNYKLAALPESDFPRITEGDYAAEFEADLRDFLKPVAFAISKEEARYYLDGVFLSAEAGSLVAVATDGHRLAKHVNDDGQPSFGSGVIVPAKMIGILPAGKIKIAVSDTKIRFDDGVSVIVSKLIDGTYPDYERVIPKSNNKIITVDRDALLSSVGRVAVVSSERGRAVRLTVENDAIELWVAESGEEADETLECRYDGEPITVGLNAAYLETILQAMPAGDLTIALADSGSPVLFRTAANDNWTGVVMPMRV